MAGGAQKAHISLVDLGPVSAAESGLSGMAGGGEAWSGALPAKDREKDRDKEEQGQGQGRGAQSTWKFSHPIFGVVRSACMSDDGKFLAVLVANANEKAAADDDKEGKDGKEDAQKGTDASKQTDAQPAQAADDSSQPDAQAGGPAGQAASGVAVWRVDTHKIVASRALSVSVRHVSLNPEEPLLLAATGDRYARLLKCAAATMEETPILKRHKEKTLLCGQHAWLGASTLAVVVEQTGVAILHKGDVQQTIPRKEGKDSSAQSPSWQPTRAASCWPHRQGALHLRNRPFARSDMGTWISL